MYFDWAHVGTIDCATTITIWSHANIDVVDSYVQVHMSVYIYKEISYNLSLWAEQQTKLAL